MKTKVYKIVLCTVDHDNVGAKGMKQLIENVLLPNHIDAGTVVSIEERDIEWTDEHPLNSCRTHDAEFARLFGGKS